MTTKSASCLWAQVSATKPFPVWWEELCQNQKWQKNLVTERWDGADLSWGRVLDSVRSFTLFHRKKVVIISHAEKAVPSGEKGRVLLQPLHECPHHIVLVSESPMPKGLSIPFWKSSDEATETDEYVAFKWIDAVHSAQLSAALQHLDLALEQGRHPLALLQLMTRDFRIGQLIQFARESRYQEQEIEASLRVRPIGIKKWIQRKPLSKRQWADVLDRLFEADLHIKSGADGTWVLRKLTFDLVRTRSPNFRGSPKPSPKPQSLLRPLWTPVPSFA